MAKYSRSASKKVAKAMRERKRGTLKSGAKSRKKVTSRKQAIAIGLSEARRSGARVPSKRSSSSRKSSSRSASSRNGSSRRSTARKSSSRKSTSRRRS